MGQLNTSFRSVHMSPVEHLLSRFSDVSLSDLNYELGKAKESLVSESGNYLGNLKTDATMVTKIIKTESNRLNETYFDGKIKLPQLGRSLSLPQFRLPTSHEFHRNIILGKENDELHKKTFDKISLEPFDFGKLDEEEELVLKNTSHDMQLCFIDDDNDGSEEDLFPASNKKKIDYFVDVEDVTPGMTVKQTMQNSKELKLKSLQDSLRSKLSSCKENASKRSNTLQKQLIDDHPLSKLLGIQKDNWVLLENYEADVLKRIVVALKAKIATYNNELVELLEEKDALEVNREEKVNDIHDLVTIL